MKPSDLSIKEARAFIEAHEDGDYQSAAGHLISAFCWVDDEDRNSRSRGFWEDAHDGLHAAMPIKRPDIVAIFKDWIDQSATAGAKTMTKPLTAQAAAPSPTIKVGGAFVNRTYAQSAVTAYERGDYRTAQSNIDMMGTWAMTPQGDAFWRQVCADLGRYPDQKPNPTSSLVASAIATIKGWLSGKGATEASMVSLSEDAVYDWARARGMTLIKVEDLKELQRHGNGGVPKIDAATFKRINNFS